MFRFEDFARSAAIAVIGGSLSIALAAGAAAQDGPRITGWGTDTTLEPNPNGPVFGGALTRVIGSGESAQIEVVAPSNHVQAGRLSRLVGSGESQEVVYLDEAPAMPPSQFTLAR